MADSNSWIRRIHGSMAWWRIISNHFHNYQRQNQPKPLSTVTKLSNLWSRITITYCQCRYGIFVTKKLSNYKRREMKLSKLWDTIKMLHKFNCGKKISISLRMCGKYIKRIGFHKMMNKIKLLSKGRITLWWIMEGQGWVKGTELFSLKNKRRKRLK